MQDTLNISDGGFVSGEILIRRVDSATKKTIEESIFKNIVVVGAADLMAMAISGDRNSSISCMYIIFSNDASVLSSLSSSAQINMEGIHAVEGDSIDFAIMPVYVAPKFSVSNGGDGIGRKNNIVTFYCTTASLGAAGIGGVNITNGTSKILQCGLAAQPNKNDFKEDKLFSFKEFSPAIAIRASEYVDIFWTLTFK